MRVSGVGGLHGLLHLLCKLAAVLNREEADGDCAQRDGVCFNNAKRKEGRDKTGLVHVGFRVGVIVIGGVVVV